MKVWSMLLLLALIAGACGGSSSVDDLEAVAESSASTQPEVGVSTEFCNALAVLDADAQGLDLEEDNFGAFAAVAAALGEVVEAMPPDSPQFVAQYFEATERVYDQRSRYTAEALGESTVLLPEVLIVSTIVTDDIDDYVAVACPATPQAFRSFVAVSGAGAVRTASIDVVSFAERAQGLGLCPALSELEVFVEATEDADAAAFERGKDIMADVLSGLPGDAPSGVVGYMRGFAYQMSIGSSDLNEAFKMALLLSSVDQNTIAPYLDETCPEIGDTRRWLFVDDPFTLEGSTHSGLTVLSSSDTLESRGAEPAEPAEPREGYESVRRLILSSVGTVAVGAVEVEVGEVEFSRQHEFGTGREADKILITIEFSFDRGHEFAPEGFLLTSNEGQEFPADPEQAVPLDEASLRFPVNQDITTLSGWTLTITDGDQSASIDL